MKKAFVLNGVTLLVLIAIIILSVLLSKIFEIQMPYLILLFAGIKFVLVAFQFMEVKRANWVWKSLVFLFVSIYLVGAISLF